MNKFTTGFQKTSGVGDWLKSLVKNPMREGAGAAINKGVRSSTIAEMRSANQAVKAKPFEPVRYAAKGKQPDTVTSTFDPRVGWLKNRLTN